MPLVMPFSVWHLLHTARVVAAKTEHLKSVEYAALKVRPLNLSFCRGNVQCAWSDSTQHRLGHCAMPAPGNRGGTQQGVPPPKESPLQYRGGKLQQCSGP